MENALKTLGLSRDQEERAFELHKKSIIIDSLSDGPPVWSGKIVEQVAALLKGGYTGYAYEEIEKMVLKDLAEDAETREKYVKDVEASGVTAINKTVASVWKGRWWTFDAAVQGISRMSYKIDIVRKILVKAIRAEDIRKAKADGKMAVIFGFQNTNHMEDDFDNIDLFYRFGVRIVQLTYSVRNSIGEGSAERYQDQSGLSYFGQRFVERLNRLGIVVDTSHCGYRTTLDTVAASADPVIASHTACKAVYDHPRAKSDEEIKAIAEKGGYIGIYAVPFIYPPKDRTINHLLNEIDHAVEVAGVDHIGVGTDHFGPYPKEIEDLMYKNEMESSKLEENWLTESLKPELSADPRLATYGIEDFTRWPNITKGLVSRGYSDSEIQKIVGGNFLKLFERVVG